RLRAPPWSAWVPPRSVGRSYAWRCGRGVAPGAWRVARGGVPRGTWAAGCGVVRGTEGKRTVVCARAGRVSGRRGDPGATSVGFTPLCGANPTLLRSPAHSWGASVQSESRGEVAVTCLGQCALHRA